MSQSEPPGITDTEPMRCVRFVDSLEDYRSFFDSAWANGIVSLVTGSRLVEPVDSLIFATRAIDTAHRSPSLLVDAIKAFGASTIAEHKPALVQLLDRAIIAIAKRTETFLSHSQRKKLKGCLSHIRDEMDEPNDRARQQVQMEMKWDELWPKFAQNTSYVQGVWQTERMCYSGLYFAFESFLRDCAEIKTGQTLHGDAEENSTFRDALFASFGRDFMMNEIVDLPMQIARHARNAIVHDDGKESPSLRRYKGAFAVEDGRIQILPRHTAELFHVVTRRAAKLASKAVAMREFHLGTNP